MMKVSQVAGFLSFIRACLALLSKLAIAAIGERGGGKPQAKDNTMAQHEPLC